MGIISGLPPAPEQHMERMATTIAVERKYSCVSNRQGNSMSKVGTRIAVHGQGIRC